MRQAAKKSDVTLPRSATHPLSAWTGVAMMLLSVTMLNFWSPVSAVEYQALLVMGATAVGVFVPDLLWHKVHRRALTGRPGAGNWSRSLTKLVGLAGIVGCLALLYRIFPEYAHGQDFYGRYWSATAVVLPAWAALAVPYIYWVDRRMPQPHDGLWHSGRLFLGRWDGLDLNTTGQCVLGWMVKGQCL